jgi:hypothetical protein
MLENHDPKMFDEIRKPLVGPLGSSTIPRVRGSRPPYIMNPAPMGSDLE